MHVNRYVRRTTFGAFAALQIGWMAVALYAPAANAKRNPFRTCSKELLEAGLSSDDASAACGQALIPDDLSLCVLSMNKDAGVAAEAALSACFQVRRPLELATCVLEINDRVPVELDIAVENCQRSLLPLRFSDCVVGVVELATEPAEIAVRDCISAEMFPLDLTPIPE
ncbi:hypothetical protein KR51_00023670 [Rubidibacter lacunae KORDI 51-2]|uniref:Uncharacterized protein n=1 Tax=Rubidibacter lacunae KORDI 51-2 TaxID=582515 RepID=U5DN53_9CHRO|nr:hypothetical protein [Rubidibacter lacunae]ERN41105.1 hypothetical protein KR51_00023670 [Rubidibacter lacunae KORDI 51-2]